MFPPSGTTVIQAVQGLGWNGEVVGPLWFGGARFWAVAEVKAEDGQEDRPEVRLVGCLVGGAAPDVVREASLLAAYAPRAVLVDHDEELTGLLVDAAILDQGVVAVSPSGTQVLATAGPRVAAGPVTAREQELLNSVFAAWQAVRAGTVPCTQAT